MNRSVARPDDLIASLTTSLVNNRARAPRYVTSRVLSPMRFVVGGKDSHRSRVLGGVMYSPQVSREFREPLTS